MTLRSATTLPWRCVGVVALLVALPLAGCGGGGGGGGTPAASTGTLTGTVTNARTGDPVPGLTLSITPSVAATSLAATSSVTDGAGVYSVVLPEGSYTVSAPATPAFAGQSASANVLAAETTKTDLALAPKGDVVVTISGAPTNPAPGAAFTLTAEYTILDGSTFQSVAWSQKTGAAADIGSPTGLSTGVTLASAADFKAALLSHVEPLERWRVLPVSPLVAEEGSAVEIEVEVTTTSGTYPATVEILADLPNLAWANGLQNVPVNVPVMLAGKTQGAYAWALTGKPGASAATLHDADSRYPWLVPDATGKYTVTVTDTTSTPTTVTIELWAGKWVGGVEGRDLAGNPTTSCAAACHASIFPEKFSSWAATGHARIFTDNVNTGGHYGPSCFPCHTVGYDPTALNDGLDDATGYSSMLAQFFPGGVSHPDAGNYDEILAAFPVVAQKTNIQCENCHGPNGAGSAHTAGITTSDPPESRVSVAADVCGYCHGEPPRHGRFQQWQRSGHANYELAVDESQSTSCARCHVAQGFLKWLPQVMGGNPGSLPAVPVPAEKAHPQTCVVCHDPHAVGTTSGDATDAPMRVEGSTPKLPSGFAATNVGKGAMCMMCHNTRNGTAAAALASRPDSAPHVAAQTDVLMGENAFFVDAMRSPHSLIADTCVTCHVELSSPPADLSMGGTNHTFSASLEICSACHGEFTGDNLQAEYETRLEDLAAEIEHQILLEIQALAAAGKAVKLYDGSTLLVTIDASNVAQVSSVVLVESHGRAAMDLTVGGTTYAEVQLGSEVKINGTTGDSLVKNPYLTGDPELDLGRACWNYFLLHGDGSKGVHNPFWALGVMQATTDVLVGLSWSVPPS